MAQQLRRSQSETERSKNPRYKHPARPTSFRLDKKNKSENHMGHAIAQYGEKANSRAIIAQPDGGEGDGAGNSTFFQWAANLLSPTPTPKAATGQANDANQSESNYGSRYSFMAAGRGIGGGIGGGGGDGVANGIGAAAMTSSNANHASMSSPPAAPPYAIVCLGVAGLDMLGYVGRFPSPDEKVRTTRAVTAGGGNAANTAVAIARLGEAVGLATCVGLDREGDTIVEGLQADGVDVA